MAKRGRPTKYTEDVLNDLKTKLETYIEKTQLPILSEFAYKNNIHREELYKHDELNYTIKKLITKKEAQLERLSLENKINYRMAIFSLKQLGWKDNPTIEKDENKDEDLTFEGW